MAKGADLEEIGSFHWQKAIEYPVEALAVGAQITFTSSSDDKQTGISAREKVAQLKICFATNRVILRGNVRWVSSNRF